MYYSLRTVQIAASVVSVLSTIFLQAEFFNSYLSDPKRPQVPEGPSQRPPGNHVGQMYGHQGAQSMMGWAPRPQMMMYGECTEGFRALSEHNINANILLHVLLERCLFSFAVMNETKIA